MDSPDSTGLSDRDVNPSGIRNFGCSHPSRDRGKGQIHASLKSINSSVSSSRLLNGTAATKHLKAFGKQVYYFMPRNEEVSIIDANFFWNLFF